MANIEKMYERLASVSVQTSDRRFNKKAMLHTFVFLLT